MKVEIEQPVPSVEFRFNGHVVPAEAQAPSAYTVVRIVPNDPAHRKLFPKIVERALGFIDRLGADTDPIWLMNLMVSNFFQATNLLHVVAALDPKGKIVGHTVSCVETRQKLGNVVLILQIEKDCGGSDLIELGQRLILDWARSIGIRTILNESDSRAKSRLWSRFGFREYRIVSRLDLE
mgnify:FL=1